MDNSDLFKSSKSRHTKKKGKQSLTLPSKKKSTKKLAPPLADNGLEQFLENSSSQDAPSHHDAEMASLAEEEEEDEPTVSLEQPYVPLEPLRMPRLSPSVLLNDDEYFNLDDNIVRRIIYGNNCRVSPAQYREKARIICLNFTRQHFEPGATKWYHLKEVYYDLLSSVFNALAFTTGKKRKLTPPEKTLDQAKETPRRANKKRRGDQEEEEVPSIPIEALVTTPETELTNFLRGDKDITAFVETLVTGAEVSGYRWWIFDRVDSKSQNDSLSLGLRESLLEAAKIQVQVSKEMQAIAKNASQAKNAKAKKSAAAKQYAITKEYGFTQYGTFESHFTGLVNRYFNSDPCLAVSSDVTTDALKHRQFKDTRPYTDYNTLIRSANFEENDYAKSTHPCNLSSLFSKEASMFYYVGAENVNEAQCRLESYFNETNGGRIQTASESAHANIDFLKHRHAKVANEIPARKIIDVSDYAEAAKDEKFLHFPYENITYHIDNTFLSHEFISRMPLPHRIGTTLYTQRDVIALKKETDTPLNTTEAAETESESVNTEDVTEMMKNLDFNIYTPSAEENELQYNAKLRFMGIHETELELTADLLLTQPHHTDSSLQSYLKFPVLPRDVLDKFLASKRNEIHARLRIILTHLGPKNRTVVGETMAALVAAQEISRNKSLSSMMLPANLGDGRDQASHMMDQITHSTKLDENDVNLLQLPYVSFSPVGMVRNRNKSEQIKRKANEIRRRRALRANGLDTDPWTEEERQEQELHEKRNYDAKIASGKVAYVRETIERYRPYDNSLYALKTQLPKLSVEEIFLGRDIGLRLAELNGYGYENLFREFIDPETGKIPADRVEAFLKAVKEFKDALVVECFNEFKESRNVSYAHEGIRNDLMKRKFAYVPPATVGASSSAHLTDQKFFGTPLPIHESRQELRPWGEFRTWVQALFSDQFGIAYNFKPMWVLYVASKHHCRWKPFCNSPSLNVGCTGNGMGGKSHLLKKVKSVLPTGVGDMVTHITDQAFNVDRNMNDMLLIYEEMQNKYFGYSTSGGKNSSDGGGGGGTSAGSDRDTTNFFKSRLTSGETATMQFFENEETGQRDMKISKASVQGNMLFASNNDFTPADANVLTRFILLSVPKSKSQFEGERPHDKNKHGFGIDTTQDDAIIEQHKEIHRIYFLMEQMIKARVINDNVFGVNCDGGRIQRDLILDHLQKHYGIATNDIRKRDFILEFARCLALLQAVWMGLTSPLTRPLQFDPHDPSKFIGFNPRVITEGIMPFMVVTKDHIIDAITSLSSLWYHDYQDTIMEAFATTHCRLTDLRDDDFLVRSKTQAHYLNLNALSSSGAARPPKRGALHNSGSNSAYGNSYAQDDDKEIDYNYIVMRGKSKEDICQKLSHSLGDMVVASGDISKLLHELEKCRMENIDGYTLEKIEEAEGLGVRRKLVRDKENKTLTRQIVEFGNCPTSGATTCAILVHFIKQKLPALFSDDLIKDLNKKPRKILVGDEADKDYVPENEYDMQIESSDISEYERKVRAIGLVNMQDETLLIKSFKDIYENEVLEDPGMDLEVTRELEASYANPTTGIVPWHVFITADAPKQASITDFYPELKDELDKIDDGNTPIRFVDELKMLHLKRKKNGKKIIIRNHNTVSPSTRVTQSIYKKREKQLIKRKLDDGTEVTDLGIGEVLKKARIEEYSRTEAWELDRDIDAIFCREHLFTLGFQGLESKPQYELINYPPCTYMAVMEDRVQKEGVEGALLEYPYVNNVVRIESKKKAANALIKPDSVRHPKFHEFMLSNFAENSERSVKARGKSLKIGTPIANRSLVKDKEKREALMREISNS